MESMDEEKVGRVKFSKKGEEDIEIGKYEV